MLLKAFSYKNHLTELSVDIKDFSKFNLLVGLSGAGKTTILHCLSKLTASVFSMPDEPFESCLSFEAEGKNCEYYVNVRRKADGALKVCGERLVCGGSKLIDRDSSEITVGGNKHPAGDSMPSHTLLSLLEIPELAVIKSHFSKIIFYNFQNETDIRYLFGMDYRFGRVKTAEGLSSPAVPLLFRFEAMKNLDREAFEDVKSIFISLFPSVSDIKFDEYKSEEAVFRNKVLYIKEGSKWVSVFDMSSGMLKTLLHLVSLVLVPPDSAVIFDEIENSLGINCIDFITDELLNNRQDIQFIITSHHPYVINNVDPSDWLIIERNGSKISAKRAADYRITRETHDPFLELLNKMRYGYGL